MERPELDVHEQQQQSVFDLEDDPEQAVEDAFPFPRFRPGQKDAILRVLKAFQDHDFVVLSAPTGSGKTAIGTTLARLAGKAYYTTPQNSLIDQIINDDHINTYHEEIKGRRNYDCTNPKCTENTSHTAKDCPSQEQQFDHENRGACCNFSAYKHIAHEKQQNPEPLCEYPQQLERALDSPIMLTNFHYYIVSPHIGGRPLTVLDEAHNLENIGFGFCDISLTKYTIPFFKSIRQDLFQHAADPVQLRDYIISNLKSDVKDHIDTLNQRTMLSEQEKKDAERLERLLQTIGKVEDLDTEFVVEEVTDQETGEKIGVRLKPLYVDDFFQRFVFPKSKKFLFSSATMIQPEQMLADVGVYPDDVAVVEMPNQFPVEHRPIRKRYACSMKYTNVDDTTYRKIAKQIDAIASQHANEKGIVHCVSYGRQNQIETALHRFPAADRVMVHESQDSDEQLAAFKRTDWPAILLSVAMEEGVDLKDEQARFNIIPKLPNPSMGDERVNQRALDREEWQWYFRQTAINLVQAYGRTTRSQEDRSTTYVLDQEFEKFLNQQSYLLPDWFYRAVSRR